MKNIILCDLDGTLADIKHRRHFVSKTKACPRCGGTGKPTHSPGICSACTGLGIVKQTPDWPAFFAACVDDTPLQTTIDAVNMLAEGMCQSSYASPAIWIVSGRSDEVRVQTVEWLLDHGIAYDNLIMRKAGDYTPDDVLKRSWLNDGTIPKDRVFCVFDDRDRVVQMWREEGLTCYQVANGDF